MIKKSKQQTIDREGQRLFEDALGSLNWGINRIEEDFGVDYDIQVFVDGSPAGCWFKAQLKSSASSKYSRDGTFLSQELDPDHARHYALELSEPIFLFHADIDAKKVFWCAPQLDDELVGKLEARGLSSSVTIRIPTSNVVPGAVQRLAEDLKQIGFILAKRTLADSLRTGWFEKEHPVWRDERFKRVGIAYGYLDIDNGKVQFSQSFIDAFAKESNLALAQLDPNHPLIEPVPALGLRGLDEIWPEVLSEPTGVDEIWEALRHKGLMRALKRPLEAFDAADYDYFNAKMMEPLVNYLLGLALRTQLITTSDSGGIKPDQGIIDAAMGLAIGAKNLPEANVVVMVSLGRTIPARLITRAPDLLNLTALLVMFFFWLMDIGPYLKALELTFKGSNRRATPIRESR
jgi:hypothetical protein